jgi:phosphatidylglycerophosphate synthase
VGIAAFLITLTLTGRVAVWFASVVVARDLLIAGAGIYLVRRLPSPPSSNIWGKLCSLLLSLYLARQALLPSLQWPGDILPGLDALGTSALCMVIISLAVYASGALSLLGNPDNVHRKRRPCT